MTAEMQIKALAPWFGGKRTLAATIVGELGPHKQYFEPFCGSLAVLLHKEPSRYETVNDLHGDVVNLARCVQDWQAAPALYERLARTLVSEDLLLKAASVLETSPAPGGRFLDRPRPSLLVLPRLLDDAVWHERDCHGQARGQLRDRGSLDAKRRLPNGPFPQCRGVLAGVA